MRFPFLFILFLAVPLMEIAAFVLVGSRIGVIPTLVMVLVTALVGSILLRVQGFGMLRRIREEVDAGRVPQRELVHGVMILLAGFLLLLPGFVTDAVGFLLFVPAFRDAAWRFLSSRIAARVDIRGVDLGRARQRDTRTIDLDEEEYSRSPDPDSPWKRD